MARHVLNLCRLIALLSTAGCAVTLGSSPLVTEFSTETFNIDSTGIGANQTEAERDAWHEAAFRLRAMGYTSFRLDRTSLSTSGGGPGPDGQPQYEVRITYKVEDARRSSGGCSCDLEHGHHRIEEH